MAVALGPTAWKATAAAPSSESPATGSLHGFVRLGEKLAGRKLRFSFYPDTSLAAPQQTPHSLANEMANVVVYFESVPVLAAAADPRKGSFRIEQRQEAFFPHVLPVVVGTTVEFTNADPIYHNVFSLSKAASFDLGRYPKGTSRAVRFDQPGIVEVFCHIHSDMSAVVMVLDNPFFAVPDANGEFLIPAIPPGRYKVSGWHERARLNHQEATIEAGRRSEIAMNIPLEGIVDGR